MAMNAVSARPQILLALLITAVLLYVLSLFLPAIIYKGGTYHDYSSSSYCGYYDTTASSTNCHAQEKVAQAAQITENNKLPKRVDRGLTVLGWGGGFWYLSRNSCLVR